MTPARPRDRRFTLLALGTLALALGAAYSDSFAVGFHFDGLAGIAHNPAIRSLRNIPRFFVDPTAFWTEAVDLDLRPILLTSYALNYAVSGLEPWSYHALNLVVHFTASALVFFLVRDHLWWPKAERGPAGDARIAAALVALLFAVAPLNSQPVLYLWARSALLCATLYLGAFLAYLTGRRVLGSLLFALSLLTKAVAVTLPAALLAHAVVYRDRERHATARQWLEDWRQWGAPVLAAGLVAAVYLVYRAHGLGSVTAGTGRETWVTSPIWLMSEWSGLVYYVRLFLWPDALSLDHDFPFTASGLSLRAWGSLLLLVVWVTLALRAWRSHPQVTFATVWFFVTLAPESSLVPIPTQVINEHRPYLATSLGLSLLLGWVILQAAARLAPHARRTVAIGTGLLLCLPAIAIDRHRTWQWGDTLRLWEDTVRKSPNNPRPWLNGGVELAARGNLAEARRFFERGRDLAPGYFFPYMNLAALEAQQGNLDAAYGLARRAIELEPDDSRTHYHLGVVLERVGQAREALAAYRRALELNPRDAWARAALAQIGGLDQAGPREEALMTAGLVALYRLRDPAAAALEFRRILDLNSTHFGATFQLARALDAAGKRAEADPVWRAVLAMADSRDDHRTADTVRGRLGLVP